MSHRKKKNDMYVVIYSKFGDRRRFLGNRVHPGMSAAISWVEKHYPDESRSLYDNFSFCLLSHNKLMNMFLEELKNRLGTSEDGLILRLMAESLAHGKGIRIIGPTGTKTQKQQCGKPAHSRMTDTSCGTAGVARLVVSREFASIT